MTLIRYFNVYEAFNDIEVPNISLEVFVLNQKEAEMNSARKTMTVATKPLCHP